MSRMDGSRNDDPHSMPLDAGEVELSLPDSASERKGDVEALVVHLEPRILEILERSQLDPAVACSILEEIVTLLLYRWDDVALRDSWFLEMLEHRVQRCRAPSALGFLGDR